MVFLKDSKMGINFWIFFLIILPIISSFILSILLGLGFQSTIFSLIYCITTAIFGTIATFINNSDYF